MKSTFFNLTDEKRENLIRACIIEFSVHNYGSSSINRIIKIAGISKGGLYKYTSSKSDLYIYILTNIMEEVISYQTARINNQEDCFFQRISTLLKFGFEYYEQNQLAFQVMLNSFYDITSPIYSKINHIRKDLIKKHQVNLLKGIDWHQYNLPKEKVIIISEYLIEGFNVVLLKKLTNEIELVDFKIMLYEDIEILISTLKKGLIGDKQC